MNLKNKMNKIKCFVYNSHKKNKNILKNKTF